MTAPAQQRTADLGRRAQFFRGSEAKSLSPLPIIWVAIASTSFKIYGGDDGARTRDRCRHSEPSNGNALELGSLCRRSDGAPWRHPDRHRSRPQRSPSRSSSMWPRITSIKSGVKSFTIRPCRLMPLIGPDRRRLQPASCSLSTTRSTHLQEQ